MGIRRLLNLTPPLSSSLFKVRSATQWSTQGQNYTQYHSPSQVNPNRLNSPTHNFSHHQLKPQQNPNQWNSRTQKFPQYPNPGQLHPNVQDYQQPSSPQWNNQNQGHPQARNPVQWAPQGQTTNEGRGALENQAPAVNTNINVPSPATATVDLMLLCQEGKVKETIELMDKGG